MFTDHIHDQLGRYRIGAINDSMPEFVKIAEEKIVTDNLEKLANGCFAYSDGINRYFPLHTPEHVWMSHAYFEKFANEFSEQERPIIRERIKDAYNAFELPEANLIKIANVEDEIDAIHSLSIELNKFIDEHKKYPIHERRIKAKELIHHAKALGKQSSLHDSVYRYAGDHFKKNYGQAFADRMKHFSNNAPERETLLRMQNECPKHIPELVAKALGIFDNKTGLSKHYDQGLNDPYTDLLSPFNVDNEDDIKFGEESIPGHKLKKFNFEELKDFLSDDIVSQLKSNPIDTLRATDPSIRLIIIRHINGK